MPRITDFCICIYVLGCKLRRVRLCDSDFGITPVDYITIGITCFHIAHISFASSWHLFCLSVIVLARLCVFGRAMSIKKLFFVFLFIKVMSGRLKCIVLSVSMLRFQYSLKFSFSCTLLLLLLFRPSVTDQIFLRGLTHLVTLTPDDTTNRTSETISLTTLTTTDNIQTRSTCIHRCTYRVR